MRKLLNPKLLFVTNTLPIALLFVLGWSDFKVIKSLLTAESILLWESSAYALGFLAIITSFYAIARIALKKRIELIYCIVSLIVYTSFIYIYYSNFSNMYPFSIPRWMGSGNMLMYVGSFIMPTLLHSLFGLVVLLTRRVKNTTAWHNLLGAIIVPFCFYFLGAALTAVWDGGFKVGEHITFLFFVFGTIVFLFFLLRFIYIIMLRKGAWKKDYKIAKMIIALIMPVAGLTLNYTMGNVFGDFSNIGFAIVAATSGILIIISPPENRKLQLLLYFGRCATFIYTLYFFFVFMPFLPLSFLCILFMGAGFLMLTPLMLFPIHLNEITKDFGRLKQFYRKPTLYGIAFLGLLIIPSSLILSYLNDKKTLSETLEYIYSPDYSKKYNLDISSIEKTLNEVDDWGKTESLGYSSTPFLSSLYKWIVLDNMNIAESKKKMMRQLFDIHPGRNNRRDITEASASKEIRIVELKDSSRYDAEQQAWISWVNFTIANNDVPIWDAEYRTHIDLPVGCWISDYYLDVNGVREPGILAEKKAATWIFNQIRRVNRDPGFLRYLSGNKVEFKVYPFQQYETRYTGIEFIHKEPVSLQIDGHTLHLGDSQLPVANPSNDMSNEVMYISAKDKNKLETVERQPYFHFIVDISKPKKNNNYYEPKITSGVETENKVYDYISKINSILNKNLIPQNNAKISLTSTYVTTIPMDNKWEEILKKTKCEGGFYLDRAMKKILYDAYQNPTSSYPVIVVLSQNLKKAIYDPNISELQFASPESTTFHSFRNDSLFLHTFDKGIEPIYADNSFATFSVKAWPSLNNAQVYLPNDNKPSIILNTKNKTLNVAQNNIKKKDWTSGLNQQGQWMLQNIYPQTADKEWLTLVQNSFQSGIMSPLTSYIVVETEAQKEMLKLKQAQTLSGNRSLDLDDDTRRMSEPNLILLVAILALLYLIHKYRKENKSKANA